MSQQYDNTNRGVLFKNHRKEKPSHPDYSGNINVGGSDFWISAWLKEGKKGKFFSLSIKPAAPAPQQNRPTMTRAAQTPAANTDEDVPF